MHIQISKETIILDLIEEETQLAILGVCEWLSIRELTRYRFRREKNLPPSHRRWSRPSSSIGFLIIHGWQD